MRLRVLLSFIPTVVGTALITAAFWIGFSPVLAVMIPATTVIGMAAIVAVARRRAGSTEDGPIDPPVAGALGAAGMLLLWVGGIPQQRRTLARLRNRAEEAAQTGAAAV